MGRPGAPRGIVGHFRDNGFRPVVLVALLLFQVGANFFVVSLDQVPLFRDDGWYFMRSLEHLDNLNRKDVLGLVLSMRDAYPPAHELLSIPFYALFGTSPDSAILGDLILSTVLILSIYHLGKELHNSDTGLLAAAIAVLLPGIFAFSRTYLQEIALSTAVALSLALMLKTRFFSRAWYVLAFGLSVSLGILVRWEFSLFVIGPFLVYVLQSYNAVHRTSKRPGRECIRRTRSLLLIVCAALVPAALWYFQNIDLIVARFPETLAKEASLSFEVSSGPSLSSISFYLRELLGSQLQMVFSAGLVVSLLSLILKKRLFNWKNLFLGLWILVPYFVFTFMVTPGKSARYTTPYVAATALLIAVGIMGLPSRVKKGAIPILLVGGLIQVLVLTFIGTPADPYLRLDRGLIRPDTRDWHMQDLITLLNENLAGRENPSVLLVYSGVYWESTLTYLQMMGKVAPFSITDLGLCMDISLRCGRSEVAYREFMEGADIILLGNGEFWSVADSLPDHMRAQSALRSLGQAFQHAGQLVFPNKLRLDIYARRTPFPKEQVALPIVPSAPVIYFDTYTYGYSIMTGGDVLIRLVLEEGARPTALVLRHARPEGGRADNPSLSISINNLEIYNASWTDLSDWNTLELPLPSSSVPDSPLDVRIKSSTRHISDGGLTEGRERGLAIGWFRVICGNSSACVREWDLQ